MTCNAIEIVPEWNTAGTIIRRTDFDPTWWRGEDRLAATLMDAATRTLGAEIVGARMAQIELLASNYLQTMATDTLIQSGLKDMGLGKSAAGAATIAVHHAALALAAGEPGTHPFAAKFRLFQAGRWPLGVYGDAFYLF